MEKIWLKSYPPDVPEEIDASIYPSLIDLFEDSFYKYTDRPAFACMGQTITYGELDRQSRNLAAWLQSKGLQPGARVAVMLPNILQHPITIVGVLRAGCVAVNVNPMYTARELEHQLKDSEAEAIVVLENCAAVLEKVIANTSIKHVVVASVGDLLGIKGCFINFMLHHVQKTISAWHIENATLFNDALADGAQTRLIAVKVGPDDLAFLQYTGGTTGTPKGAMLLHRNIVANVLQTHLWGFPILKTKTRIEQLTMLAALPLYHIFSLTVGELLGLHLGALTVLVPDPRNTKELVKVFKSYSINLFPAVNTLYNALLHTPDFEELDFSNLMLAQAGGMAIQEAVARRWLEVTGMPIIEGYGLSEASPVVTSNPTNATEYSGTIGLPFPSTEVSIRDDAGNPLPTGQAGEICIRGPQVMAGYWKLPQETAQVMTEDGFLKSGDIGIMDERGFITVMDRKKDVILVSGFNVYPKEIEEIVAEHPGVLEVAAIGIADDHAGEVVKLFVVKKDSSLAADEIRGFCKERLTNYKRPRFIEFCNELPKSNVGKILRKALREKEKPIEKLPAQI